MTKSAGGKEFRPACPRWPRPQFLRGDRWPRWRVVTGEDYYL